MYKFFTCSSYTLNSMRKRIVGHSTSQKCFAHHGFDSHDLQIPPGLYKFPLQICFFLGYNSIEPVISETKGWELANIP